MNKASSMLISFCLLAQFSANANTDEKNWYAGASIGSSSFDVDNSVFNNIAVHYENITFDKNDTGFKVFGGYQMNQYFAIEVGYADLGGFSSSHEDTGFFVDDWTPVPGEIEIKDAFFNATTKSTTKVNGLMLNGVAQYPFTDSFAVFAKLGAFRWTADATAEGSLSYYDVIDGVTQTEPYRVSVEEISSTSDYGTDAFYGVGLSYQIADFDIRAEYEIYKIDGESINVASIGALYRF